MSGYLNGDESVYCVIDSNDRFWLIEEEKDLLLANKSARAGKIPLYQEIFKGANLHVCNKSGWNYLFLTCKDNGLYYGDHLVLSKKHDLPHFSRNFGSEVTDNQSDVEWDKKEEKINLEGLQITDDDDKDVINNNCSDQEGNCKPKVIRFVSGTLLPDGDDGDNPSPSEPECDCPKCRDYNRWRDGHDEYAHLYTFVQNSSKAEIAQIPELVIGENSDEQDENDDDDNVYYKPQGLTFMVDGQSVHVGLDGAHLHLIFPIQTWNKYML